jgi:hypothetical protein
MCRSCIVARPIARPARKVRHASSHCRERVKLASVSTRNAARDVRSRRGTPGLPQEAGTLAYSRQTDCKLESLRAQMALHEIPGLLAWFVRREQGRSMAGRKHDASQHEC